jgi:rare lipoprotein A
MKLIYIHSLILIFTLFFNTACSSKQAKNVELGKASWYGEKYHGKQTASGETYNMYALTAAHKTLPFHTKVKVTNLKNNRSLVVRINDRGPFVRGRIIDLSYAGAQELDFVNDGVVKVRVERLY